ncbi:MAG: hypothetical protein N4A63_09495 [Vallitalea sp.]|jgi:hypothetical protein|nr:hypothetical protein [Vallitalea sp.]
MGKTVLDLLMHFVFIGTIFGIFVAIRNKWFKTEEYGNFEKGDQFVLLLIVYTLSIFTTVDINGINKEILIRRNYSQSEFVWIPFKYLALQQDYFRFLIDIGKSSDYHSLMTLSDYFIYYSRLILISLPISFLLYVVTKRKWVGLISTIGVLILGYGISGTNNIGDGLLMGLGGYILVTIVSKIIDKKARINLKWVNYVIFGALVTLVLIFVVNFHVNFDRDGKLVKTVPFEKQIKTYGGLITLNFEDVSLYKGGMDRQYLSFHGNLDFDEKLFEGTPVDLRGAVLKNNISVTHEYSFEGKEQGLGTNSNDFSLNDYFSHALELHDYNSYVYDEKGNRMDERLRKDPNEADYFEYYGVSDMSFNLKDYTHLSGFEILEENFKRDKYLYYEVVYKIKKFKGFDVNWWIYTNSFDKNSNSIKSEYTEPKILKETDEYIIKSEKHYYYQIDRQEIDSVEVNVHGGRWDLGKRDVELLFTIDKEMFK